MKLKRVIIVFSIAICAIAFTAFSICPSKPDEEKTKKEQSAVVNETEESNGPCACSKFKCSKGHALEFSAMAYKKYSGKKCFYCKGSGKKSDNTKCTYCDGDGKDWSWQSGCVCKQCGESFEQPDNC